MVTRLISPLNIEGSKTWVGFAVEMTALASDPFSVSYIIINGRRSKRSGSFYPGLVGDGSWDGLVSSPLCHVDRGKSQSNCFTGRVPPRRPRQGTEGHRPAHRRPGLPSPLHPSRSSQHPLWVQPRAAPPPAATAADRCI